MESYDELVDFFSRSHNPATIMRHLSGGAAARAEISAETGMDRASVSRSVRKLTELGLVKSATTSVSSEIEQTRMGRPRTSIVANDDYWLIGVHIGVHGMSATRVGIGSAVGQRASARHDGTVKDVVSKVIESVERIRKDETSQTSPLAVGVTIGAPVNPATGVVMRFPELGWENVRLGEILSSELDLPVALESIGRATARAQMLYNRELADETFAVLYVGAIVEYLVVENGQFLGNSVSGGFLRHLPVSLGNGKFASVQAAVSDEGIASTAKKEKLLAADEDFEDLLVLSQDNKKAKELLVRRAHAVAALIAQLQEITCVPSMMLAASVVRTDDGFAQVQSALNHIESKIPLPLLFRDREIVSATALAAASTAWHALLDGNRLITPCLSAEELRKVVS